MAGGTIRSQAEAYMRSVRGFVRRTLLDFGRRLRSRMMVERIGGGPQSALQVKTGKLKRSFRYQLVETATGYSIEAKVGGGPAGYAEDHEDRGRLEFQNTFEQEAQGALSAIETGLQFLAKNPFAVAPSSDGGDVFGGEGGGPARAALLSELRMHYQKKREAAKLRRRNSWRSMVRGS